MATSIFFNDIHESVDFCIDRLGLKLLEGRRGDPGNVDMAFVGEDWNSRLKARATLRLD